MDKIGFQIINGQLGILKFLFGGDGSPSYPTI